MPPLYELCETTSRLKALYLNPTGLLCRNININLQLLYGATEGDNCMQVFPYGRDQFSSIFESLKGVITFQY